MKVRMEELMLRLGIEKVEDRVKQGRLRWFGHVERKEKGDWVSDCRDLKVGERGGRGRRKKSWDECAENDMREWGLSREMARNRDKWRNVIHGNRPTRASTEKRT